MPAKKRALGKGLDALFPAKPVMSGSGKTSKEIMDIPLSSIRKNPHQVRTHFDEEAIGELAQSIREKGVVQPVIVCRRGKDYVLVAGERRWRASKVANLKEIPAIVVNYDDSEMLQIALIENIQREGLNAIEEAQAYKQLSKKFGLKQEEIADKVGKNRSSVANALRLLNLSKEIQQDVYENRLTAGHARALLSLDDMGKREVLRKAILRKNLSVRQAEELASLLKHPKQKSKPAPVDPTVADLEEQMIDILCTRVKINRRSNQKGKIEIYYNSLNDLDRLFTLLGIKTD